MKRFILGVVCGALVFGAASFAEETSLNPFTTVSGNSEPTVEERLASLEFRVNALEQQQAGLNSHCGPPDESGFRECW